MPTVDFLDRRHRFAVIDIGHALEAEDGLEGLDVLQARGAEIGLVLLDMSMPRMSGREALAAIRRLDHRPATVIFTGYAAGEEEFDDVEGIIEKPFTMKQLLDYVRQALLSDAAG